MQTNVRKTIKMNVEIFNVVYVHISREIFVEDRKVGQYRPDRNQGRLFVVALGRRRISR